MAANNRVEQAAAVDLAALGALLDAGDGAVVMLVAGQTQLVVHRAVLCARSPVFQAMFAHDTAESRSGLVEIPDVEGPVLRQLVSYCYSLRDPQPSAAAPHLLAAADKYGLPGLKAACEQLVAAQLTVENAAAAAVLAVRHSCPALTAAAVDFIRARNFQVMATQGWADAMRAQTEDLVEVSRLLAEPPAEIKNLSEEEKGSRLIQAAEEGSATDLRALLAAGADLGFRDRYMGTALHCAARNGHVEAVRCLAECGADLEARNRKQSTPLHLAAWKGHAPVVRLLLARSADHSARSDGGNTPLHNAAAYGHTEAAVALLEAGADRGATDDQGRTPRDLAMHENHQEVVRILR